jgi:glycine cleavage system aminomethyltransferase T
VTGVTPSPLETVALTHGAVLATRGGRRVPAHFGSVGAEEAVCLKSVGMADRADRHTFELTGTAQVVEAGLTAISDRSWSSFLGPDRALARCEHEHAEACEEALAKVTGLVTHDRASTYAVIGLVGPRAQALLAAVDLNPSGLVLQQAPGSYEVLLPAERGPELWEHLLEAGTPYDLACVGHDALDRLAAAHRLDAV